MLNTERLWRAAVAYLPIVATVLTLAPVAGAAHTGIGIVVLGAAVCLTTRHRGEARPRVGAELAVRLLATTAGVSVLAWAFSRSLVAGDALFLATLLLSRLAGRYGPRWAGFGRMLLLPLTALFIAPPVSIADSPLWSLLWACLACLVAVAWTVAIPAVLPFPAPSAAAVIRAARRAAATGPGAARERRSRALATAALALDRSLTGAEAARAALITVEYAVDKVHNGSVGIAEVDAATRALAAAVARATPTGYVESPADPRDAASPRVRTRLALQATLAVALAFLAGQTLYPQHWPWTVVTVITVGLGARSRGDVVVKSGQRLAGALLATAVATALAAVLSGHRPLMVVAILAVLGAGMYLREHSYLWWAMAMTFALALLYGLLGQAGGGALLGQRLLAMLLGAACAVGPALLLAPRSRDLVRKRTGTALRRLRECLDTDTDTDTGPDLATVRRLDAAVADLRTATVPLHLVRQLRRTPETAWAETLAGCAVPLRAMVAEPGRAGAPALWRILAQVAQEVRNPTVRNAVSRNAVPRTAVSRNSVPRNSAARNSAVAGDARSGSQRGGGDVV